MNTMNLNNCITPNWSVNEWVFLRNNYVEKVYFEIVKKEEKRLGKNVWKKKLKEFIDFTGLKCLKDPDAVKKIATIFVDKVEARLLEKHYFTTEQIKTYYEEIFCYCQDMARDEY